MKRLFTALLPFALMACAPVVSQEVLRGVDRSVTMQAVQSNPERYQGKKVLWGGVIVSSENLVDNTIIEVLETPLGMDNRPKKDNSRGRFLIQAPGYMDTLVYKPDMEITVAGEITGVVVKKIGKMDYPFPAIRPIEMKLFEPYGEIPVYPYWWDYPYPYHGPYFPGYWPGPSPWPYYPWPPRTQ